MDLLVRGGNLILLMHSPETGFTDGSLFGTGPWQRVSVAALELSLATPSAYCAQKHRFYLPPSS